MIDNQNNNTTIYNSPDLELLTAKEAAGLLKVHYTTVYEMMERGEIRTVKFGRSKRIRKPDLEAFISSHTG